MSIRSFRSVFMVASCAGAALGCYLVSLRVASERASLEDVESQIVLAQRDIRLLQTEIGTRGRLAQLERWNVQVLALSAPAADQFLKGSFELARLTTPQRKSPIEAPVVLASAPLPTPAKKGEPNEQQSNGAAADLMHTASLKVSVPTTPAQPAKSRVNAPEPIGKVAVAQAQPKKASAPERKVAPAAEKKLLPKAAAKPALKAAPARDPLAPLPAAEKKSAPKAKTSKSPVKKP